MKKIISALCLWIAIFASANATIPWSSWDKALEFSNSSVSSSDLKNKGLTYEDLIVIYDKYIWKAIIISVIIYFIPTYIVIFRGEISSKYGVIFLNLFFWWFFVTWFIALFLALVKNSPEDGNDNKRIQNNGTIL